MVVYIDDILLTGKSDTEHLATLRNVLQRAKEHNNIRFKKPKCKFLRDSVEFLGHIIDKNGIHATPEKVKAVVNAPQPKDVSELRAFLGLQN